MRDQEGGKRRKNTPSKIKRESKKLECFMNYEGAEGNQSESGKGEWEIVAIGRFFFYK